MGIKDLWHILGPFCERKPLYELQGKTVAIDLSCWICEAKCISDYQIQPRMYLRNLYFRTCCLLLLDVHPVFVLDGKAPTLKYKTIAARNALQFRGEKPKGDPDAKQCKDRSRFNYTLKQCEEMLKLMGIACVKGNGEAEALCAHLNEDGLVHGCITQDSDSFAYGARIVFRNFSISQQGVHAGSGGSVDVYDIDKLRRSNGIGRNKIIALALLCGSDYNDGVFGVGKDSVVKLFNEVPEEEILDRLRSWRMDGLRYDDLEKKTTDKTVCSNCGHSGRLPNHNRSGCKECGTSKGCVESDYKEWLQIIKNEVNMRRKALEDPDFPNEDLIQEFQKRKDNVHTLDLKWRKPDMIKFVYFCRNYLEWDESYIFEKFLPILTRWQLLNVTEIKSSKAEQNLLVPEYIKKVRNPKGIPSYEIVWLDRSDSFKALIPEEQLTGVDLQKFLSTIEPQGLVDKAYPELVSKFLESKAKPRRQPKRKKAESDAKPKRSRKQEAAKKETQRPIDSYFKKALMNSIKENYASEKPNQFRAPCDFDPDMSSFGDENDSDLSDIVEEIVTRKPDYIKEHLENIRANGEENGSNPNNSSFFVVDCVDEDMFEKTFNELCRNDSEESKSEEDIVDVQSQGEGELDDSFAINYIPLAERVKMQMDGGSLK